MKADKKQNLLESDDEEEDEAFSNNKSVRFSINTKYAKEYQRRKQTEELRKEEEGGRFLDDDDDDDDSSESSSEDEDAELLTTKLDTDILKTINAVRQKDKSIYDRETRFFPASDEGSEDEKVETKKRKPKRMKDVLREQILEQMDEENKEKDDKQYDERTSRLAYDEQQQQLRKAFIDSTNADESGDDDDDDDDTDGNLLVVKRKIQGESDKQADKEFQEELQRMEQSVLKGGGSLVDPRGEVEDGEKFLLDYFKNKTWIEKDDFDVGDDDDDDDNRPFSKPSKLLNDDDSLEELEKADDFESKYNFRFEEAAAEAASSSGAAHSLMGFARSQTMNTLRRKDDTRKEKRLARKERKAAERRAKEEKLKRLKNAKRQQMEDKMKQVGRVLGKMEADSNAGADEAAIMKLLEGDFDPEKFEAQMQEAFGDEFYKKEDSEWKTDEDVEAALMNDEQYKELIDRDYEADGDENAKNEDNEADDNDEAYDDDDPMEDDGENHPHEETELEKKMRTRMMDKLYELDYEDIVAGMPTRFKYRQVEKNDFGLSAHEILLAKDSTLKQLVSLKKLAPYREKGEYKVSNNKRKRFREMLEQDMEEMEEKMKEKGITPDMNSPQGDEGKKKKRRRLKKKTEKADDKETAETKEVPEVLEDPDSTKEEASKKRRRKKKGKKKSKSDTMEQDEQNTLSIQNTTNEEPKNTTNEKPSEDEIAATREVSEDDKNETINETIKPKKRKKKKNKKGIKVEGISQARLAAYDL